MGRPEAALASPLAGMRPVGERRVAGDDDAIGRAGELAQLHRFIEDQTEPAMLVGGPRGFGRTALLRHLHRSHPTGTVLVRVHGMSPQQPWTGMSAMLGAIGIPVPDTFTHGAPGPEDSQRREILLLDAVRTARIDPVVVLLDDLDLHDEASRSAFAVLADRLTDGPVRLLATVNLPMAHDDLAGVPLLRLDPLCEEDLLRIAASRSDRLVDPVTADLLARTSGGNPGVFRVHLDQLTAAQRSGRAPLSLPLPPAYPDEIGAAAQRYGLEADDRRLLQRIATAPAVSSGALRGLAGEAVDRIERLVSLGLLSRESGFVSVPLPELRSLLYWDMSADDRRTVHAEAASAEEHSDPDLVEWHRSHLTADSTSPSSLYAAATSLLVKGVATGAFELAERALALTGVGLPVHPQLEFARQLMLHGAAGLARRHLPRPRAAMSRRQVFQRATLELLIRALADDDLSTDPVDALVGRYRTELPDECAELSSLAGALLVLDGDLETGARRILAAEAIAPPEQSGSGLHRWAARLGAVAAGRPSTDRRSRLAADAPVETRMIFAVTMMWEGRHAAAREAFAVVLSGPGSLWERRALTFAAENELRAGDAAHALDLIRRIERGPVRRSPHESVMLASGAIMDGRLDDADTALADIVPALIGHRQGLWLHAAGRIRGEAAMLRGDIEAAFTSLRSVVDATPGLDPSLLRCHAELVEAQWRLGDLQGARATTEAFLEAAAGRRARWTELALLRCRALLADDVLTAFSEALGAFEPGDSPLERAKTQRAYALAAERAGLRPLAAEQRRLAMESLHHVGALGLARSEPTAGRIGRPGAAELPALTDAELAVIRMARAGAHNREIAAALFMSLRTVELRLTQIYRKFGARSRAHLFSLLPDGWPDDRPGGSHHA